ncbi:FAD/FMN-containing dehydrogenase [Streptomyces sp. SLBN-118]|uniref:FAD-binding oxidoreductase n=1 Tax=Streptomyces sp. SLBN-118 TaxID=2768454 RepID=UPI00117434C8|nr:FAD-binding oxidoreductase [Streptomyces sp. SLBN-118]TQK51005.1 FAD/FMN-containing dehydrogenase [Streptomyces sp. SLBN-118]
MRGPTQARRIEGDIVRRGEPAYERAWEGILWNGLKPHRFPDVIVRVASERDVPEAVALARSEGLRIAVRAGGHSWVGSPLRDGGMLIDLAALNRTRIDPDSATATVQPAVTGSALAAELSRHGLAFPTGHCGSVAVGGYLLSGGLGWNSGALGPACASVRQIEAVTAAGEVVTCDAKENSDLFWAARGAGPGFFAIVTSFRLALYPRPAAIITTTYAFPLADVVPVTRWFSEAAAELPPTVEVSFLLGTADPAMSAATPRPKVVVVAATAFADSKDEAIRALGPLRACPLHDRAVFSRADEPAATFETLYDTSESLWPASHRCGADTLWSGADYETLLSRLAAVVAAAPSERSLVLAPVSPVSREKTLQQDMAFSVLGDSYVVPFAMWDSPAQDGANIRWLRDAMRAVEPLGTGHYIAEADLTADPSRARRSFSPSDWDRLERLKERYDPDNVFFSYLGR